MSEERRLMTTAFRRSLAERLSMDSRDIQVVLEILAEVISGHAVWAFGSRAAMPGTDNSRMLKRFSDLDLAVEGKLTWLERAVLSEAFEKSLLPIKVDVVELGLLDAEFRERIRKDFLMVQAAGVVA